MTTVIRTPATKGKPIDVPDWFPKDVGDLVCGYCSGGMEASGVPSHRYHDAETNVCYVAVGDKHAKLCACAENVA